MRKANTKYIQYVHLLEIEDSNYPSNCFDLVDSSNRQKQSLTLLDIIS